MKVVMCKFTIYVGFVSGLPVKVLLMIESTHIQSVDFKDLVLSRVQLKEVVLTSVDCKAVELLAKSEAVNVELSQASLSSHQSNWKVKSRAQATGRIKSFQEEQISGEKRFQEDKKEKLTFHDAELIVEQIGLVDCENQSKLLDDMQPHLDQLLLPSQVQVYLQDTWMRLILQMK